MVDARGEVHSGRLVEKRSLLDETEVTSAVTALAAAIVARNSASSVAIVGIRTGGAFLAERIRAHMASATGVLPPRGTIDIALYRDDVFDGLPRPAIGRTELLFPMRGTTIVLIDDVLFTGRTIRAALDALVDHGRPRAVQLAILVDRGHRELPIQADFVGLRVETTPHERVKVHLRERGGGETDRAVLYERETP
jgi:pyrimidine operon attenuation protein / uracil phosphoribosyltransferase